MVIIQFLRLIFPSSSQESTYPISNGKPLHLLRIIHTNEYTYYSHGMFISKRKNEPTHYMLKIESFSLLSEASTIKIESDIFEASGHKWRLSIYPKGSGEDAGKGLSFFLTIHDVALLPDGWRVYAKCKLCVKNQSDNADIERELVHWFCDSSFSLGYRCFMLLSQLSDPAKGFLLNGSLIVEAEFSLVGMLKNFI
ncbi:hypothetical protein L6452_28070 [Arctium lappa]|uniref:Uncharacterized protein n=1 Tax=Arctium lappa TaxID=4217 RepID=A0ACB8ZX98_ARCLA|nr:hypothetical protein L6452_28070 [Arctium lappa]